MHTTIVKLGRLIRKHVIFDFVLNLVHKILPSGYSLVEVERDGNVFRFYTHYEGLGVIDEVLLLKRAL